LAGWTSITSSQDGTKLAAADGGGYIHTSTDSGINWTLRGTVRFWYSITSSADGTKLAAVDWNGVDDGYIYTSTDSGVTWTERTHAGGGVTGASLSKSWTSITSSPDGTKLAATVYGGYIYTSTDSGATWTTNSNSSGLYNWNSITSSAGGAKLAAIASSSYIYTGLSTKTRS